MLVETISLEIDRSQSRKEASLSEVLTLLNWSSAGAYHIVKKALFMFKISSKYLDVVLKASIISDCLSSERVITNILS